MAGTTVLTLLSCG